MLIVNFARVICYAGLNFHALANANGVIF